ncbi:hypothetical protein EUA66_04045 [TM7 phylum sp. oral taxon 349]|nr:hypothetical protein J5A52_04715 [TM7 phylum sp. oral taxon 349]TWP20899.1 hypothetical protein EUA66_04045 [TM7 phylum sp. oral taxon 349]
MTRASSLAIASLLSTHLILADDNFIKDLSGAQRSSFRALQRQEYISRRSLGGITFRIKYELFIL